MAAYLFLVLDNLFNIWNIDQYSVLRIFRASMWCKPQSLWSILFRRFCVGLEWISFYFFDACGKDSPGEPW